MRFIRLSDVCAINMGQSPDSSSYNDAGNGLPFFQGNADFGDKHPVTRVWCSEPTKIAHAEDILISVRAPIGAMNYAKETCCIGRGLAAITPDKARVSPEFIFWLLKGKNAELNSKGTGSTFKAISRKVLEEVLVLDISLEQQTVCAKHLETVYDIIQTRQRQLRTLDTLIKARFVEMFGDETNPYNWPIINVGDIAAVTVGVVIKPAQYYTDADHGIKAFRSLNVGEMHIKDNEWVFFSQEGNDRNSKSQLHENDLIIIRSGAPGVACVVTKQYEGCNAIDIIIARPDTNKIDPYYLCMYTNMPHGKRQIEEGTGGAAQQHFNVGKYNKLRLMLPPMEKQNQFSAFVSQVDKSKVVVKKALNRAQLLFDSLMQQYFG